MDRVHSDQKIGISHDLLLAWRAIADGTTAQTTKTREKYWKHWTEYCHKCKVAPYLTGLSKAEQATILIAFAAQVRTGAYSLGNQVRVQSVSDALAAITKTYELVGQQSPVYQTQGEYILPIKRLLEGFSRADPPATPQLAVPAAVPARALKLGYLTSNPRSRAVGDLVNIGFFFLLRSGEYTKPRQIKRNGKMVRATWTVQFRVADIGFWRDGKILPRRSNLQKLLTADAATLKIDRDSSNSGHVSWS